MRYIATTEAVVLRLGDPILWHQKRYVQTLHLPWSFKPARVTQVMSELTVQDPATILPSSIQFDA